MNKFITINYVITATYLIKSHRLYCRKEVYLRRKMLFSCLVWESKPQLAFNGLQSNETRIYLWQISICLHLSNWCQPLWLIFSKPIIFLLQEKLLKCILQISRKGFQMISWNNISIKMCNCCIMQNETTTVGCTKFLQWRYVMVLNLCPTVNQLFYIFEGPIFGIYAVNHLFWQHTHKLFLLLLIIHSYEHKEW